MRRVGVRTTCERRTRPCDDPNTSQYIMYSLSRQPIGALAGPTENTSRYCRNQSGSARRQAATYTGQRKQNKRTQTQTQWDSNLRSQCSSERRQLIT
jgi:hypothetical protein